MQDDSGEVASLAAVSSGKTRTTPLLIAFIFVRLVVSTVFRMVFPFLPALARGMEVPVESVSAAVSARSVLGLLGPPLGAIADLRGRKQALIGALILFGLSMVAVGVWPTYAVFFIGLVLTGGATVIIDSSIHAYLGDHIPYAERGRASAAVELGWSLAFVIGIPLMAVNMARSGWSAPFLWLGLAGLLAGGLISLVLKPTPPISGTWRELREGLRKIFVPAPLLGLLLAVLLTLANQVISIVFGIWMEQAFGLQLEQLGAASIVIGVAGLVGVAGAMLFTDKLGKRRAIGLGLVVNSVFCLSLPLFGRQLWGALAVLFLFYLSFEFALTSLFPLMTTLSSQARGVFMAAMLAALSLGDAIGALLGPILIRSGLLANAMCTTALNLGGLFLLIVFVKPREVGEALAH
ncbi:MAG TPA: MFS transporter [Anaerolineales bacterium]|nr:MFS transporter [Anaerolineales bacterium]